jgi:hypothetical protein
MSGRKRKNAVTLISLLLATVALIVFYLWYSGRDQEAGKKDTTQESGDTAVNLELAKLDTTLINTIRLVNQGADLKLHLQNDLWKSEAEPDRPINQDKVKDMLNLAAVVKAKQLIIEKPEDPAEYGLKEPAIYFEAVQEDGTSLRINIGDKAITGNGYYAQVNDSETVYLLDTSYGTRLAYSLLDMTALESIPLITTDNIYHILVEKKDGDSFELLHDKENTVDSTGSGIFPWSVLKPYEEGYSADGSKVSELLPKYTGLKYVQNIDYAGKDLAKYGLAEPAATITIGYYETRTETLEKPETDPNTGEEIKEKTFKEEKSYKLHVGGKDDGENYYVRPEGSSSVYTMKAEKVDPMLQVNPFGVLSSFVTIPNIENVNKIDIKIDGQTYTMEIKRETTKDTEGKETTQATYYYNGKTVEEGVFKDVYQIIIGAGYDKEIVDPVKEEDFHPTLSFTYHLTNGQTLTAAYMPYNDNFYVVRTQDNPIRFFSDKREIEEIIAAIKEFKGEE